MKVSRALAGRLRRGVLAVAHRRNVRSGKYCAEPPLIIAGSPRSGTTWLTGVIARQSRGLLVDEPLFQTKSHVQAAGFTWRTCIRPGERRARARALFEGILSGSLVSPGEILGNSIVHTIRSRRIVVKSVRATRLLGWLHEAFPEVRVVVLVRHPCAVVSSQMRHEHFPAVHEVPEFDREYVTNWLSDLRPWLDSLSSELEYRALTWALDQHAYLSLENNSPHCRHLYYERLVEGGWPVLARELSRLGVTSQDPPGLLLRRSSREAKSFSVDHESASVEERLAVWKNRLSPLQIERVLSVVQRVGIRGYGSSLYPAAAGLSLGQAHYGRNGQGEQ